VEITHALDDRYYTLEQKHGLDGSHIAADSHTAAINRIESIVKEENIDCDFERLDGFLLLDPSDKKESLGKELDAMHKGRDKYNRDYREGAIAIIQYRTLYSLP
jgi:hypothetical protein